MVIFMSGHSKWNTIKRKKEKTDSQRAKVFTKIGREIAVAVREGGADPTVNSKLKDAIAKAKANNVPNDNIDRVIKKSSESKDDNYESIFYEGYGPSGVAIIVETLTDNRNRTAGDLRHYFDKNGGNLGQTGCVSFMFEPKGVIIIENNGIDEEKMMEDCFEAGAVDFDFSDEVIEIFAGVNELSQVSSVLSTKGYKFESAEVEYIPANYVKIEEEELVVKMEKLLDMLDENDDVQNAWHNWDQPE